MRRWPMFSKWPASMKRCAPKAWRQGSTLSIAGIWTCACCWRSSAARAFAWWGQCARPALASAAADGLCGRRFHLRLAGQRGDLSPRGQQCAVDGAPRWRGASGGFGALCHPDLPPVPGAGAIRALGEDGAASDGASASRT